MAGTVKAFGPFAMSPGMAKAGPASPAFALSITKEVTQVEYNPNLFDGESQSVNEPPPTPTEPPRWSEDFILVARQANPNKTHGEAALEAARMAAGHQRRQDELERQEAALRGEESCPGVTVAMWEQDHRPAIEAWKPLVARGMDCPYCDGGRWVSCGLGGAALQCPICLPDSYAVNFAKIMAKYPRAAAVNGGTVVRIPTTPKVIDLATIEVEVAVGATTTTAGTTATVPPDQGKFADQLLVLAIMRSISEQGPATTPELVGRLGRRRATVVDAVAEASERGYLMKSSRGKPWSLSVKGRDELAAAQ